MPLVPMKRKIKSLKSLKSLKSVNLAYSGSMESGTNGKSNDLTYTLFSRYQQEVNNYGYGQRKGTERPYISKQNLTIEEAAVYSNIGQHKPRELTADERCPFVLWVGNKRLIKRRQFDEYMSRAYSI